MVEVPLDFWLEFHFVASEQFERIFTESPKEKICCGALPLGKCCHVKLEKLNMYMIVAAFLLHAGLK